MSTATVGTYGTTNYIVTLMTTMNVLPRWNKSINLQQCDHLSLRIKLRDPDS